MRKFIERVGGAIRGLFNHNLNLKPVNAVYKPVFNIRVGNSFSGHGMRMYTSNVDDTKLISFNNSYYLNSVSCVYNNKLNKTDIVERTNSKTPKYIIRFIEHLQCKYGEKVEKLKYEHVDKNEKICIWISKEDIVCNRKYTRNDMHFNNHYDNINNLKELVLFVSKIKSLIHKTDYDTLMSKHIETSKKKSFLYKYEINFIT